LVLKLVLEYFSIAWDPERSAALVTYGEKNNLKEPVGAGGGKERQITV